jgi:Ca2+-binding EF-hand superfamily protein
MAGGKGQDQLVQLFRAADTDKSGSLSIAELKALFKQTGSKISDADIQALFTFFDGPGGDQKITEKEFCDGLKALAAYIQRAKAEFNKHDTDRSGFLDKAETTKLLRSLNPKYTDAEINQIITQADTSKDGKIGLEEFVAAFG